MTLFRNWMRHLCNGYARPAARRPWPRRTPRPRLELLEDRTLLSASLVADINTSAASSHPAGFATLNGAAYFFADDGIHGTELWKSNGTPGGTQLVKDLNPGDAASVSSFSPPPVVLGNDLYFFANDGVHGTQLWQSDGTANGTVPLSSPAPGTVTYANQIAVANGLLFFSDPASNNLYKTNGTPAGTAPVTDANGNAIAFPFDLANVGGALYLSGTQSGTSGTQTGLWKTDGTAPGTSFIQATAGSISDLTGVAGTAYFVVHSQATNGQQDAALWMSNGTPGGTALLHDFGTVASPRPSPLADLTAFNGQLYFAADDHTANPDLGRELWTSNGTSAGTHPVLDINPGPGSGLGAQPDLTSFNSSLYFLADNGQGQALWQTNGSATAKVLDAGGNAIFADCILSIVHSTTLYFAGSNATGSGLWKTGGSAATTLFVHTASLAASAPGSSTAVNSLLFFPANDGSHGIQLWTSDGTPTNTGMLADINPHPSSSPQAITDLNGTALFAADDGTHGTELWRSDGTAATTRLVNDLNPGSGAGLAFAGTPRLLNVNGTVYFFAYDGNPADGTVQLWKTNGSTASTRLVKGFTPRQSGPFGFFAGLPDTLTNVNGELFFVADDGVHGLELWKSDGTRTGTILVQDLNPGPNGSNPADLTAVGGTLFFTATAGTQTGLWRTDGTTISFLEPGAANLVNVGTLLYFTAPNPANPASGPALWKTDGTTTTLITSLGQGNTPRRLTNVNGTLFFVVDSSTSETLWMSNGSPAGTGALHTFTGNQPLSELTAVGSTLYFIDQGSSGPQLWLSNGTAGGTGSVSALQSAFTSSAPYFGLTNVNGTLVFAASDPSHGQEVWTSNGTARGTALAQDVNPGVPGSFPHGFAAVAGRRFFAANDGIHGTELFADTSGTSRPTTTTNLNASATSVPLGQPVAFTATVTPTQGSLDGGSVTFLEGQTELGTVPVTNGSSTLNVFLGTGQHNVTAVYLGDVNFAGSTSASVTVAVISTGPVATTTSLTASATTVQLGQFVGFTATVKPPQGNVDGGNVDFTDGANDLGTAPVDADGIATLNKALGVGRHTILATYSGDASFNGSTSSGVIVTVNQPAATTTTLVVSATSVVQGQSVDFTATVQPAQGNVDGGNVDFMEGQNDLGTVPVNANGVALLSKVLALGAHNVVAVYSGNPNFSGSRSDPVTVTVNPPAATTTFLTASATSVTQGQSVTFTATVTPAQGNVDGGNVVFTDGQTDLGSFLVNANGVATLNVVLAVGTHHVVATYGGDASFSGSVSSAVTVTVTQPVVTTTFLTASATSVTQGQVVHFTATVTAAQGNVDGGNVDFMDGPTDLGSFPVNGGVATLDEAFTTGTHQIVAVYSGDAHFGGSTSSAVIVTVSPASSPASTQTILTASATAVNAGQPLTLTAVVSSNAGPARPVDGGTVLFLDGGTLFASAPLEASTGMAVLTTILVPGTHSITAVYFGDSAFSSSTSSPVLVTAADTVPLTGDVTSLLQWSLTPPVRSGMGHSRGFTETLTILNASERPLEGTLYVLLRGLRGGINLRGAAGSIGRRRRRSPFVAIDLTGSTVRPNGSISVALQFSGRPNQFALSFFAGSPPQ